MHIRWSDEVKKSQLVMKRKQIVDIMEPDDHFMELKDYIAAHGHPHTNGKGHRIFPYEGKDHVLMPGARIYKICRKRRNELSLDEVVNDGQEVLHADQLQNDFENMSLDMGGERALGQAMSLESILGTLTSTQMQVSSAPLSGTLSNAASPASSSARVSPCPASSMRIGLPMGHTAPAGKSPARRQLRVARERVAVMQI